MNMGIPLLSISWKGHSSELATECKNLLADNFLVDCTLAAQGQRLAAHRLILSASSPYFRMLFSEGREKHPIVFLKDVPFEMLKAVVDFVYHGETQIPKRNLKMFLALAQSLQITGLIDSSMKNRSENVSCSAERHKNNCEDQQTCASHEDRSGKTSQQLHIHPSVINPTAKQTPFLALHEDCLDSGDHGVRTSKVMPLHESQIPLVSHEPCANSEVTVKHEPAYFENLELKHEHVDNVEMEEQAHGKFMNEMSEVTSPAFSEEDLYQYTSSNTCATQSPSSASREECLDYSGHGPRALEGESQIPLMFQEPCADLEMTENHGPTYMEVLGSKNEHVHDVQMEEEASGKFMNERAGGSSSVFREEDLSQYTNLDEKGEMDVQATLDCTQGIEHREVGAAVEVESGPLQVVAPSMQQPANLQSNATVRLVASVRATTVKKHFEIGDRPYVCDECGLDESSELALQTKLDSAQDAERLEFGGAEGGKFGTPQMDAQLTQLPAVVHSKAADLPLLSDLDNATGRKPNQQTVKMRCQLDDGPFICEVCGKTLKYKYTLTAHTRMHTGEQLHRCDVCKRCFILRSNLKIHMRIHTGERPYRCDVCGYCFTQPGHLVRHKRIHTGERPYRCDLCGFCFKQPDHLVRHKRIHTAERPYHCDVCGDSFKHHSTLINHKRIHMGE